jgi:hypothetical protein
VATLSVCITHTATLLKNGNKKTSTPSPPSRKGNMSTVTCDSTLPGTKVPVFRYPQSQLLQFVYSTLLLPDASTDIIIYFSSAFGFSYNIGLGSCHGTAAMPAWGFGCATACACGQPRNCHCFLQCNVGLRRGLRIEWQQWRSHWARAWQRHLKRAAQPYVGTAVSAAADALR